MMPEGYITWNGGRVIDQDDDTVILEIWTRDQRGYSFDAKVEIPRKDFERPAMASSIEPTDMLRKG